jgi:hypothetical protein
MEGGVGAIHHALQQTLELLRTQIDTQQRDPGLLMGCTARLKKLNRDLFLAADVDSEDNKQRRSELERVRIDIENLRYRKRQLQKDLERSLAYKPKSADLNLPDIERTQEFVCASRGELAWEEAGDHQRYIFRLDFELAERQRLVEELTEIELQRDGTLNQVLQLEGFLSSLPSLITQMSSAVAPLRQQLASCEMISGFKYDQAKELPQPLFVLYSLFLAHASTFSNRRLLASLCNRSRRKHSHNLLVHAHRRRHH